MTIIDRFLAIIDRFLEWLCPAPPPPDVRGPRCCAGCGAPWLALNIECRCGHVTQFPCGDQPYPLDTQVAQLTFGDATATAIMRTWAPGDAQRCRLCFECTVNAAGSCLVITDWPVNDQTRPAPLFNPPADRSFPRDPREMPGDGVCSPEKFAFLRYGGKRPKEGKAS